MKTTYILLLTLGLAACGGNQGATGPTGATGPQGAPGKSAYEIWLEQGNVGTEQDFLDSLVQQPNNGDDSEPNTPSETVPDPDTPNNDYVYSKNFGEEIAYQMSQDSSYYGFTNTTVDRSNGETYNKYRYKKNDTTTTHIWTYNEKELKLGNYITFMHNQIPDPDSAEYVTPFIVDSFIWNREANNANVYTPDAGAVFSGGTLAYIRYGSTETPQLIEGDATFTYDPDSPTLALAFDNYYNMQFDINSTSGYTVDISGTNSTGDDAYNLPTGEFNVTQNMITDPLINPVFLSKDGVEEGFGTYNVSFSDSHLNSGVMTVPSIEMTGSFGGTKQ